MPEAERTLLEQYMVSCKDTGSQTREENERWDGSVCEQDQNYQ